MEQWIFVARLLGAAVCGGLIGYERQSRKKTAGVRTHVIISVAAATMMIISKYGFNDVLGEYVRLDPSRVAAGIVTAVGFIGSGIIFFRNNNVSGITTSAGIWATVGVGYGHGLRHVCAGRCVHDYCDGFRGVFRETGIFFQKGRRRAGAGDRV